MIKLSDKEIQKITEKSISKLGQGSVIPMYDDSETPPSLWPVEITIRDYLISVSLTSPAAGLLSSLKSGIWSVIVKNTQGITLESATGILSEVLDTWKDQDMTTAEKDSNVYHIQINSHLNIILTRSQTNKLYSMLEHYQDLEKISTFHILGKHDEEGDVSLIADIFDDEDNGKLLRFHRDKCCLGSISINRIMRLIDNYDDR